MARPTRASGNLPAEATSFIGRRRELAELRRKLTTARVVSLVGPGGVGKTRLAIRIATDLRRGFREGAWLVELAEVQDPPRVGDAVLAWGRFPTARCAVRAAFVIRSNVRPSAAKTWSTEPRLACVL